MDGNIDSMKELERERLHREAMVTEIKSLRAQKVELIQKKLSLEEDLAASQVYKVRCANMDIDNKGVRDTLHRVALKLGKQVLHAQPSLTVSQLAVEMGFEKGEVQDSLTIHDIMKITSNPATTPCSFALYSALAEVLRQYQQQQPR